MPINTCILHGKLLNAFQTFMCMFLGIIDIRIENKNLSLNKTVSVSVHMQAQASYMDLLSTSAGPIGHLRWTNQAPAWTDWTPCWTNQAPQLDQSGTLDELTDWPPYLERLGSLLDPVLYIIFKGSGEINTHTYGHFDS